VCLNESRHALSIYQMRMGSLAEELLCNSGQQQHGKQDPL
jgi:hypothetical protein